MSAQDSPPHTRSEPASAEPASAEPASSQPAKESIGGRRKRAKRWWLIGGASLLAGIILCIAAIPWIVAHTELRNRLLKRAIPDEDLLVTSRAAELGWATPVKLSGLSIRSTDERMAIDVQQLELERSWLQAWREAPHFGEVKLVEPHVDVLIEDLLQREPRTKQPRPFTLSATIQDATVRLRSAKLVEPVIELEQVDARIHVDQVDRQSVLEVERTQLFDHYPLRPELFREGLQLIAPVLANATRVEGSVSLDFDHLRLPLGGAQQLMDIEGTLQLHEVTTGLNNPILQEAVGNLATMFGFAMPKTIEFARDAVIPFVVREQRVHHEDIHFLLPAVTGDRPWKTSGSVGFDQSLDLTILAPVPVDKVFDSAVARLLSGKPLKLRVGGTIDKPELTLPEDSRFIDQLGQALVGRAEDESDVDYVLNRMEAVIETGEALAPIWQRTQKWFQRRPRGQADNDN